MELTLDEYERVRADPVLFAMLAGHDIPDVEDIVARTDRYVIARKKPQSWPVVEETDPRADER